MRNMSQPQHERKFVSTRRRNSLAGETELELAGLEILRAIFMQVELRRGIFSDPLFPCILLGNINGGTGSERGLFRKGVRAARGEGKSRRVEGEKDAPSICLFVISCFSH